MKAVSQINKIHFKNIVPAKEELNIKDQKTLYKNSVQEMGVEISKDSAQLKVAPEVILFFILCLTNFVLADQPLDLDNIPGTRIRKYSGQKRPSRTVSVNKSFLNQFLNI